MVLSHEQEEQLIELVNENTHLWNPKDINYKNKHKRQTKFDEIGQRIGSISAKEVSEKFRNLKIQFMREFRKVNTKRSGDSGDVYVSKWKHFQKMHFLKDTIIADESYSNLNNSTDSQQELEINDETEYSLVSLDSTSFPSHSSAPTSSSARKKKKTSNEKSGLLEVAAKILSTPEEKNDEEMAFCRSLAASLRRIAPLQKEIVKLEVQQVIVRHSYPEYYSNNYN